jgi:ectoine hydroxylase-related dioxygenase (phytanoyl-CoA dioxygenase family)
MNIFKDISLQKKFERDGYVVMPFLSAEEVMQLRAIYKANVVADESFHSTSYHPDLSFKKTLDEKIRNIIQPHADAVLSHYRPLGAAFLTKNSGPTSAMPIHQDWTVTDEKKFFSATIWIPLQDTSFTNGAIQVIPGSHRFSEALRSPSLEVSFTGIYHRLQSFLKLLPMKAGEAFIFNHALMHASPPNLSGEPRIAVAFGFVPQDASLCMYYATNNHLVEKYSMPDDMFLRYPEVRFGPRIGVKKETFSYSVPPLTIEEVNQKIYLYRKSIKMKPLFKNPEHQQFFEENGYIKLPALNEAQIQKLTDYYYKVGLKDSTGYGFHIGMDIPDKERVKIMMNTIKEIALPAIEHYFDDVQFFTASYVIKEPNNPRSVVPPHQDWSFVEDEQQHCSVTCWITLQDVNMENGCMGVIKGSNKFFDNVRPSPSPQAATPLKNHMFNIFPFLELIEMKAGEALIFDNRTIHASPPNATNAPRVAVGLGFTQKEAALCHYYLKPGTDNILLKYKITPDFFLKYDNITLSKMYDRGETIQDCGSPEEVPYVWEDLSAGELAQRITAAGNTYKPELVEKMTVLFSAIYPQELVNHLQQIKEEATANATAPASNQPEPTTSPTPQPMPFWKVYTPINILREIKYRLTGG